MKLAQAIQILGNEPSLLLAEKYCGTLKLDWNREVKFVFNAIIADADRVPGNISGASPENSIEKWLNKYKGGYDNRASQRISNPPGTIADPIIENIIVTRLDHLNAEDLLKVRYGHRLGMSAENILGLLLEEYLATRLAAYGWHCAWGETVRLIS